MRKTVIILSIFVLIVGSCRNLQQESISEKHFDNVEVQLPPVNDIFNELEMDTTNWVKFKSEYTFAVFYTEVYTGKIANIDFTGNELAKDKDYVDFIMADDTGINFGGHYTIIHKSCGCMCENIFVIDRISGKIFNEVNLTTPENRDGKWGYLYKSDSKMLIAHSNLFTNDSLNCYTAVYGVTPELYVWTGENFKRIQ